MNIAICDDNRSDIKMVHQALAEKMRTLGIACQIHEYTDAADLLHDQNKKPFDVVFLDIDMPRINGMDTAERIGQLETDTEIIFVTNHDELVYKAYRFKALGFIRKKLLDEELDESIALLRQAINRRNRTLTFNDSGKTIRIRMDDIMYIQSDDHYALVVTKNGKETVRLSLNAIEAAFPNSGLIRIHVRYLVNYQYIYSIEKNTVMLYDKTQLPLSRNRVNHVKQQFQLFIRRM